MLHSSLFSEQRLLNLTIEEINAMRKKAGASNTTTVYNTPVSGLWSSSSAINAIKLETDNGSSFVQYSTAYLYGISNA